MVMKLPMQRMLMSSVVHDTKVTHLKGVGYGVRILLNGQVNQEMVVESRTEIGPAIREMLRMEDKCGNISGMADNSRHRLGRKGR